MLFALFIITQTMSTFSPGSQDMITALSPISHYQLMLRGVVGVNDLGAFVSVVSVFLALTWFQLERRRWR